MRSMTNAERMREIQKKYEQLKQLTCGECCYFHEYRCAVPYKKPNKNDMACARWMPPDYVVGSITRTVVPEDKRFCVFENQGWKCADCGEAIDFVCGEIHHIIPFIEKPNDHSLDNLVALCHECHKKRHRGARKEFAYKLRAAYIRKRDLEAPAP